MAIPPVPGKKLKGKTNAPKRTPQHSASAKKKAAASATKKKAAARKVAVDPSPGSDAAPKRPVKASAGTRPAAKRPARVVPVAPARADNEIPVVAGKTKKLHKKPQTHRGLHRLLVATNVFLVLCIVGAAGGYGYLKFRLGQLDKIEFSCTVLRNCGDDDPGRPMNVLMVGSDTRANISADEVAKFGDADDVGGERTDTMMVLHIDPQAEKASILSIPRDLYVPIAGVNYSDRINTAYGATSKAARTSTPRGRTAPTNALGDTVTTIAETIDDGPARLIATIRQSLGIEIDHYIQVDFTGFRSIVDAVGGVTVPFPAPARDKLAGLEIKQAGCVSITGDQALAYVRSRHFEYFESGRWRSDPTGDIGRIQRQQDFIRRMLRQAISKGVRNPIKLNSLISAGIGNVKIDDALSTKDILNLGKRFRSLEPEAVEMLTLPTENFRTRQGAAVLRLKATEAREIIDRFNGLTPPGESNGQVPNISPATVRVLVLNGTGIGGQAGQVQRQLATAGFGSGGVGDAPGGFGKAATEIRYGAGQLQKAQLLQAYMVNGAKLVADNTLKGGDLQLILGSGFGGVRASVGPVAGGATTVPSTTTTTAPSPIPQPKGAAALAC